jgi:hypothetical protein
MDTDDIRNDGLDISTSQWFGVAIRELKGRLGVE